MATPVYAVPVDSTTTSPNHHAPPPYAHAYAAPSAPPPPAHGQGYVEGSWVGHGGHHAAYVHNPPSAHAYSAVPVNAPAPPQQQPYSSQQYPYGGAPPIAMSQPSHPSQPVIVQGSNVQSVQSQPQQQSTGNGSYYQPVPQTQHSGPSPPPYYGTSASAHGGKNTSNDCCNCCEVAGLLAMFPTVCCLIPCCLANGLNFLNFGQD